MPANLENSAVAIGLEKVSFIPIPKTGNAKECSSYRTIALISHISKVMLKILQARLQKYVNHFQMFKFDLEKGRRTREQMANTHCIIERKDNSRKISTSASLTKPKPLTVWITTNYGKFLKTWEFQTTLPAS